jgi:replicative DNA helicase
VNKIIRWAQVKYTMEGIHHYPDAPEAVSFLRHPHRHIFHIVLYVEQFHNERDVEYILLRKWLEHRCKTTQWDLSSSCEHIAQVIGTHARAEYAGESMRRPDGLFRRVMVEVLEDNENGCLLEFESSEG